MEKKPPWFTNIERTRKSWIIPRLVLPEKWFGFRCNRDVRCEKVNFVSFRSSYSAVNLNLKEQRQHLFNGKWLNYCWQTEDFSWLLYVQAYLARFDSSHPLFKSITQYTLLQLMTELNSEHLHHMHAKRGGTHTYYPNEYLENQTSFFVWVVWFPFY